MYRAAILGLFLVPHLPSRAEESTRLLPKWVKIGGELRGRVDGGTAHDYVPDNNDFYYLHRIRLNITLTPLKGLTIFVQPQHTEAPGFRAPVLASVEDRVDFRAATVEYSTTGPVKWAVKAGRQELNFGAQRLIGSANWGNTSRSYDGVRFSREDPGLRLDLFFSTLLQTRQYELDRWRNDIQLHGFHASSKTWVKRGWNSTFFARFQSVTPASLDARADPTTTQWVRAVWESCRFGWTIISKLRCKRAIWAAWRIADGPATGSWATAFAPRKALRG